MNRARLLIKYGAKCLLIIVVSWWLGYFFLTRTSVTYGIIKSVIFALFVGFLYTFWEILHSKKKK
jgi:hypothetical protein